MTLLRGLVKSSVPSDRRTLSNAQPANLRHLARYVHVAPPTCGCGTCLCALVEQLARALQ